MTEFHTVTLTSHKVARPLRPSVNLSPLSRRERLLLACAPLSTIVFTLTYTIVGLTRPNYDALKYAVSALGLGPDGWMQSLNFIVFALLMTVSAFGTGAAFAGGVGAKSLPVLKILSALGLFVCAFFAQDNIPGYPAGTVPGVTTHGLIHNIASSVSLVSILLTCIVTVWRFAKEPQWRKWTPYYVISAIFMMVCLAAFGASLASNGPAGLFERIATAPLSILGLLAVIRLLRGTGRVSSQPNN